MNKATHHGNELPNGYGIFFTMQKPPYQHIIEMLINLKIAIRGTVLGLHRSNLRKDIHVQHTFKMEVAAFAQDLNIQKTVKYGAILYLIVAIMAMPSGICSSSYQSPPFKTPLIIAHPEPDVLNITWSIDIPEPETIGSEQDENEPPQEEEPDAPPFHKHIMRASQAYEVDFALIRAIIMAESSNNPKALSHRGAQGLMQLMPITAKSLGVEDAFDPALNIDGGVRYFRQLLDRFDGDIKLALAAYNAGSRYVRKYGGVPPFKATRIYIKKVLKYQRIYQEQMAPMGSNLT